MSAWLVFNELTVAALVARWTALLALAWVGHRVVVGRNPRWRVVLWRATLVGVAGVGLLTLAPPVLTVPLIPATRPMVVAPSAVVPSPPRLRADGGAGPDPISRRQDSSLIAAELPVSPGRPAADDSTRNRGPSLDAVTVSASAGRPTIQASRIVPALSCLWAVGVAVLAARLVLAWFGLGRIIGRSDEAPARIVGECRKVAAAIGAPAVRVVCSAEMVTPCLADLWQPVLILPARGLEDDDLKAVLAHELAHARGHDLAWNLVAHFTTIVLWFHPLAWRLRSAHAASCDAVCDAVAADFLGDVATYARTLARLALAALAPPPAPGLAMARSSDIRRRVDALNRKIVNAPLPRRFALPALLGGTVLLILIGGLGVTKAGSRASAKASTDRASDAAPAAQAAGASNRSPAVPTAAWKSRPSPPRRVSRLKVPRSPGRFGSIMDDTLEPAVRPAATAGRFSNGPRGRPSMGFG